MHNLIDTADDKKVEAIYTMVKVEIAEESGANSSLSKKKKIDFMKQASSDPLFLTDLSEIRDDFDFVDNENI